MNHSFSLQDGSAQYYLKITNDADSVSRLARWDRNHCLLEVCAKARLRAKSLQDCEGLLRQYVRPWLGTKALSTVSAFEIQILYRDLLAGGLSARSIRYTHAVLRSALKQAVRWNLILANPADLVDLPRQNRRLVGVLSVEQARAFITAITGHPYEALFALAMTTGMRPSEYLALTWNDLDLERGTVSISRTLEWRKGGWQFADTKRARSRRVVKLQAWVIALLREQTSKDPDSYGDNFIFRAKRGGPIRESHFVRRYFKRY